MSALSRNIARVAAAACAGALACNPYDRQQGEYLAGSIDPANFPAEYLGAGGVGSKPGGGLFVPVAASVNGNTVAYYQFPLSAAQQALMTPLAVSALPPPNGYVFNHGTCVAPPGYVYDPQRDPYHLDQQGSIFTDLPDDTTSYAPIVAQVSVTSAGEPCQDIKSEQTLLTRSDVKLNLKPADPTLLNAAPQAIPDSPPVYLAWPVIDPAARVLALGDDSTSPPADGTQLQQWGFYNHYLLAYLDGGVIPSNNGTLTTQSLYYPDSAASYGAGNDVLQYARSDGGYSPLCHVFSYTPKVDGGGQPVLATAVGQIDMTTVKDKGTVFYCLQLR